LSEFLAPDDPSMCEISLDTLEAFFASLDGLSNKTLLNYHTGLSALWTWALKHQVVDEHVPRQFGRPKPKMSTIEIFTEEELQQLLYACDRSEAYTRPGKRKCSHTRQTALRDKAIILTLLDSMARASELGMMQRCEAEIQRLGVFDDSAPSDGPGRDWESAARSGPASGSTGVSAQIPAYRGHYVFEEWGECVCVEGDPGAQHDGDGGAICASGPGRH
jgi:hypothetical protein